MTWLSRYLMIVIFGAVLLAGVQLPNFVQQYGARVDARLTQVKQDLAGFRIIAQRFFHGDLQRLIAAHEASKDPTFRAEATPIRNMVEQQRALQRQHDALSGPLVERVLYVVLHGDHPLLLKTWQGYSPALLLDRGAIVMGAVVAFVVCIVLELLGATLRGGWRRARRRRREKRGYAGV